MKYVKIAVNDDFDPDTHSVSVEELENPSSLTQVDVWQPEYKDVLDHGFIGLVDFMGGDDSIVRAARTSYGKGTKPVSSDNNLLRYLYRMKHQTPFEMVEFVFHVKAPIFVFRQWHRHRICSINEQSARYSLMEDDMYVPTRDALASQSKDNKQGRSDELLNFVETHCVQEALQEAMTLAYETYKYLLPLDEDEEKRNLPEWLKNRQLYLKKMAVEAITKLRRDNPELKLTEADLEAKYEEIYAANEFSFLPDDFPGVAREIARIVLPVATYSQMYWKANLRSILHFIGLRSDPHAQKEIRVYSDAMLELITPYVPMTVQAFIDYEKEGASFSRMELETLHQFLESFDGNAIKDTLENNGCGKREITDFFKKLKL